MSYTNLCPVCFYIVFMTGFLGRQNRGKEMGWENIARLIHVIIPRVT